MAPISLANTFIPSKDAVFRDLDGEAVILHLDSGTYFGLNAVGTRIWQLMERDGRLTAVLDDLRTEYDAPADVLERDLLDLVARLVDARLGEVESSSVNPEQLIVPALRQRRCRGRDAPADLVDGLDAALVGAAASHGVTALLATMPAIERWPDGVRATLIRARRGEAAAEAIRQQDLIHLLAELRRAGIQALLMKGALMA